MHVTAIIAAGGRGVRLGAGVPKQLLPVGGRPILQHAVDAFAHHQAVSDVVVALPEDLAASPPEFLARYGKPVSIVIGGERRQDSVAKACARVPSAAEVVVIHDAARPLVSPGLIDRVIQAAADGGAAIAAVRATDTVKRAGTGHVILETLPRGEIFLAQTPQAFRTSILRRALALAPADEATDEAALVEHAGFPVRIVDGEPHNLKITTADDLAAADRVLAAREAVPAAAASSLRIGNGYDLHRLVAGRPLLLGGVVVPFDKGLDGHSDADVVCHAVTDAVLGAAAAGDIGRHFPDTDPQWKGAASLALLARAAEVVAAAGYAVVNVDVVVIAQRPKLAPFVDAMRANLARALGVAGSQVSVKGKTNEGVDSMGAGESIAAHAVALVSARR